MFAPLTFPTFFQVRVVFITLGLCNGLVPSSMGFLFRVANMDPAYSSSLLIQSIYDGFIVFLPITHHIFSRWLSGCYQIC